MAETKLREIEYIKAWLFFWLLATISGFVVGAIGGGMLGFSLGLAQVDLQLIKILCGILGFVIAIPISYLFYRISISIFIIPKIRAETEAEN